MVNQQPVRPLRRSTLGEDVYETLKVLVLEHTLTPGTGSTSTRSPVTWPSPPPRFARRWPDSKPTGWSASVPWSVTR